MLKIKCTYENGNTIITRINATYEEAEKYYVGNVFNLGTVKDSMQKCVKIKRV